MALLSLGALAFVAGGMWALQVDLSELSGRYSDPLTVRGGGLVSVVFFGACLLVGLRQTLSLGPALVLDQEGVFDRATVVRAGRIPWSDIKGFDLCWVAGQQMLVIQLQNPQQYVERAWPWMRPIHRYNLKACGSPAVVSTNFLNIRPSDLVATCQRFYTHHSN